MSRLALIVLDFELVSEYRNRRGRVNDMAAPRLTAPDELFYHQIPFTHDTVSIGDPDWRERIWVSVLDTRSKEVVLDCGIGHYPNRDVQEAWAGVGLADGRQVNVRMSRRARPDLHEMRVGPFSIHVVEPLKRMRFVLDDNPSGVAFDVEVESTVRPHVENRHLEVKNGVVTQDLVRYIQLGRASGSLRYPGGSATLTKETWSAARDHSWGLQPNEGSRGTVKDPTQHGSLKGTFFTWFPVAFPSWGVFYYLSESAPGAYTYFTGDVVYPADDPRENDPLVSVEHDFRWVADAPIQVLDGGDVRLRTAGGTELEISIRAFRPRFFLRSAGYMGWRGWYQGKDMGESHLEHDVWDLNDAAKIREYAVAGAGCDHLIEARCGNDVGYGPIEYFTTPGYAKYPELWTKR
jgi:hypothetical protein